MSKSSSFNILLVLILLTSLPFISYAEPTNGVHRSSTSTNLSGSLKNLTPEERRQKIQELRRAHGISNTAPVVLTAEQRRAKLQSRLEELRRKEAAGTLTPVERKQLELMSSKTTPQAPAKVPLPSTSAKPSGATNFQFLSK